MRVTPLGLWVIENEKPLDLKMTTSSVLLLIYAQTKLFLRKELITRLGFEFSSLSTFVT